MIREIRSDADLAVSAAIWSAVRPRDAVSAEFVQARLAREPERLYLLAEHEGRAVGCGLTSGSSFPGRKYVAVGVEPEHRRRGLGTALLQRCLEHARHSAARSPSAASGKTTKGRSPSPEQHGFVEFERGVELVLELGRAEAPEAPPESIEIVELAPLHYPGAYEIWCEGVSDMPSAEAPAQKPFARWLEEAIAQELVLVALDGEQVVGFAALEDRDRAAGVAGNDLTTVRRSHRRRGIAEGLKRTQLAWAADHGYRSIVTGTDEENAGMRRLNEKLGYRPLPASIMLRRSLADDR